MPKLFFKTIKQLILDESKNTALIKSADRQKQLGEVFTPSDLVLEMLHKLPKEVWEEGKTFLDPTCGNGQFLAAALIIKMHLGHKDPLKTIYGVDIMKDNCKECAKRLLKIAGDTKENRKILNKHIRCKDGLTYDYEFK